MADERRGFVEKLFAEHRRALQAYFHRRIRTKSDAPDLAQEVYVRMLRVSDAAAIRNPQLGCALTQTPRHRNLYQSIWTRRSGGYSTRLSLSAGLWGKSQQNSTATERFRWRSRMQRCEHCR